MAKSDNTNVAVSDIFDRLANENEESNDSTPEKATCDKFQVVQRKNEKSILQEAALPTASQGWLSVQNRAVVVQV